MTTVGGEWLLNGKAFQPNIRNVCNTQQAKPNLSFSLTTRPKKSKFCLKLKEKNVRWIVTQKNGEQQVVRIV